MFIKNLLIFYLFLNLNQLITSSVIRNNQSDTFNQKSFVYYYDTYEIIFYRDRFSESKYGGFQLRCDQFGSPDFFCFKYGAKKAICRNVNYKRSRNALWDCSLINKNPKVLLDTFNVECDETDFPYDEGTYYQNTCKLEYTLKRNPEPNSPNNDDGNSNMIIIFVVVIIVLIIATFIGRAFIFGSRFPILSIIACCEITRCIASSSDSSSNNGFAGTSMRSGGGGGFADTSFRNDSHIDSGFSNTSFR